MPRRALTLPLRFTRPRAGRRPAFLAIAELLSPMACVALLLATLALPASARAGMPEAGPPARAHPGTLLGAAPLALSVVMQTDSSLTLDSNGYASGAGPAATYVQFRVTNNTGSTQRGLLATLSGLTGGLALGGGQPAGQYLPTLAPGASADLFWFIQYPRTLGVASSLTVTVSDALGNTASGSGRVITRSMISAMAGGNLDAQSLRAGVLGAITWIEATYSFGGVSAGDSYTVQPAGNTTLNAGCFQLVGSQVTASSIPAYPVGATNLLFARAPANQGGSKIPVTVRWFFRITCAGVGSTAKPFANQQSGSTNLKYSGNYDSYGGTQDFPVTVTKMAATKVASRDTLPDGGGVLYTITVTNTSTDPGDSTQVDSLVDVLPARVRFDSLDAASAITAANSMSVPAAGATGRLTFRSIPGSYYKLYVGTPLVLRYHATIDTTEGPYLNTVSGYVGQVAATTATKTVVVRHMVDLSVMKSGTPTDSALVGDTLRFVITTRNAGPSKADGVVVTDTLPAGMSFLAATRGGTLAGNVVQWPDTALAIGASLSDTLRVRVSTAAGAVTNVAAARATTFDTLAANNDGSAPASRVAITLRALTLSVAVTPDGATAMHLAGAAITQSQAFTVRNTSPRAADFDLWLRRTGGSVWLVPDSVTGAPLPAAAADTVRLTLPAGTPQLLTVFYRVPAGDTATNRLVLTARAVSDAAVADSGWIAVKRAAPIIALTRGTTPAAGVAAPGSDVTWTIQYRNAGDYAGVDPVLVEAIGAGAQLKVGSLTLAAPPGMTASVAWSTDGANWTYLPASGAGGAPAGYDANARYLRISMTGTMATGASGTLAFTARVQ